MKLFQYKNTVCTESELSVRVQTEDGSLIEAVKQWAVDASPGDSFAGIQCFMGGFVVKRIMNGAPMDFLHGWDTRYGTSCMGSVRMAMQFPSMDAAESAAAKATKDIRGTNGVPCPEVTFKAVEFLPALAHAQRNACAY